MFTRIIFWMVAAVCGASLGVLTFVLVALISCPGYTPCPGNGCGSCQLGCVLDLVWRPSFNLVGCIFLLPAAYVWRRKKGEGQSSFPVVFWCSGTVGFLGSHGFLWVLMGSAG